MSSAKVIFTYKRKRLSSCTSGEHADVYPSFSSDVLAGKHQDATKGRSRSPEKDLKIIRCVNREHVEPSINCKSCVEPYNHQYTKSHLETHICRGNKLSSACSSPQLHRSSSLEEMNHIQGSDNTQTGEISLGSQDLPPIRISGDNDLKTCSQNISAKASLGEIANSTNKDLDSSSLYVDGSARGDFVSQSVEMNTYLLSKMDYLSNGEVAKSKLTAPLLTFSRRLKRKPDPESMVLFNELPVGEGSGASKENKTMCVSSYSCEVTFNKSSPFEEPAHLQAASDSAETRNMLWQSGEKMIRKEVGDCRCPCTRSCAETGMYIEGLRQTKGKFFSEEDVVANTSLVTKEPANEIPGSIDFFFPGVLETTKLLNADVGCSLNDGIVVSTCDDTGNTDRLPVSHQIQASSADSQLTSCDGLDSKIIAGKMAEHRASSASSSLSLRPPGAFVIDCNVIPESDLQEEESDIIHVSSLTVKDHGNIMQGGHHLKSKGLELFGNTGGQAGDSQSNHVMELPKDVPRSVEADVKPGNKYLQLFSEDGTSSKFSQARGKIQLEQSPSKGSTFLGLSLPSEPRLEGQPSSKHGFAPLPFQDPYVRTREFIQNQPVQTFPEHPTPVLRHKMLLESINTRAASLWANRNIFSDKFEPYLVVWSEEELDSLWIGIRRHGRGNWHAMLLDPRLHFAPWRVARDLADQWEQEQCKLFSGQPGRHRKPQDPYTLDYNVGFTCPRAGDPRENAPFATHLSLGDVYAEKGGGYYKNIRKVSKVGSYSLGMLNISQNASPEGPLTMGLATNKCLPHWLREPTVTPSTTPHMGLHRLVHPFPESSRTSSCGPRNLVNNMLAGLMAGEVQSRSGFHYGGPSTTKPGTTDNLIVIDSDASSEETISDDHNIRS